MAANNGLRSIVADLVRAAVNYQDATGRRAGITAEVAELLVADTLGLKLAPPGTAGYDAVAEDGTRVQIKSRRPTFNPLHGNKTQPSVTAQSPT